MFFSLLRFTFILILFYFFSLSLLNFFFPPYSFTCKMSDTPSGQGNKTSHSQFNIAVMYESYRYLPSQRLLLFDPSIVISVEFSNFYFTVVMAFVTYFFFFQK